MIGGAWFAVIVLGFWWAPNLPAAITVSALAGVGLSALMMLPDVLLADVIDEDAQATGQRREGMYFGIQGFIIRLGSVVQALVTGAVFTATGYQAGLSEQPLSAVAGIRFLMSGTPAAFLVVGLLSLLFYPLRGERLRALQQRPGGDLKI